MPQAIVDPEELVRFSNSLKQFNMQLRQSVSQLNGQFSQLGQTWRDQDQQTVKQIAESCLLVYAQTDVFADNYLSAL